MQSRNVIVGAHFDISFSKDCQVCHIELVEMLSKPDSETKPPSTGSG